MSKKVWKQLPVKSADKIAPALNELGLGQADCQIVAKGNGRFVILYMGADEAPKTAKPEVAEPVDEEKESPKAAKSGKAGK